MHKLVIDIDCQQEMNNVYVNEALQKKLVEVVTQQLTLTLGEEFVSTLEIRGYWI